MLFSLFLTILAGLNHAKLANVDLEGNVVDDYDNFDDVDMEAFEQEFDDQIDVNINNNYNHPISVYWVNPAGGDIELFTIPGQDSLGMKSTIGHEFYALSEDHTRIQPTLITMIRGVDSYTFAPDDESKVTASTPHFVRSSQSSNKHHILIPGTFDTSFLPHPSLKAIGRRTTSMAAKFRCLVPKLDYWYVSNVLLCFVPKTNLYFTKLAFIVVYISGMKMEMRVFIKAL